MTTEKTLRLFVAIELPPPWLEALATVQQRMREALAQDASTSDIRLRWVRPEAIHLTLKFIGQVSPDRLEPIVNQLTGALPSLPEITLSLGRAGAFEDRRSPRVIWAGVESQPVTALRDLAQGIETWLAAAGIPRERRGFRPHLTLARLPEALTDDQRRRAAEITTTVEQREIPSFRIEHVSLMQSFLGGGGARYERLGVWPG